MFGGSSTYSKLENSDFAFVKGLVLSLDYDNSNGVFGTLDYTLQSAVGTASDPFQAQNALSNNQLPEIQIVPLDWDQTHTLECDSWSIKTFWEFIHYRSIRRWPTLHT